LCQGAYAFVDYEKEEDAQEAFKALKGYEMGGRALNIGKPFSLVSPVSRVV
jgi:RNA recognition motif-containing protein